jgi:hypothetical protein
MTQPILPLIRNTINPSENIKLDVWHENSKINVLWRTKYEMWCIRCNRRHTYFCNLWFVKNYIGPFCWIVIGFFFSYVIHNYTNLIE